MMNYFKGFKIRCIHAVEELDQEGRIHNSCV